MNHKIVRCYFLIILLPVILSGCAGVIIAGGAASAIHDRRTVGTVVEDQAIEFKGAARISKDLELRQRSNINITSYNRVVLLTGETPTAEMKARAEKIISQIPKVKRVQNELLIRERASNRARTADAIITTKAKTSLFKIKKKGFDPTRVKVVTRNKTVYLMGLVTPDEADATVERVRNIKGVKKVVKVFEYIKPKHQAASE